METTMKTLHEDILGLKEDIGYIKDILSENFELSAQAKKELKEARETSESEYVDLE